MIRRAFTLVELLVVVAIVGLIVGMTVLRLDGLSTRGRLSSAAHQIGSADQFARIEAVGSGEPRLLSVEDAPLRCVIQRPELAGGHWAWSAGRVLPVIGGVALEQPATVRIAGDGSSRSYACVLRAAETGVGLFVNGATGESEVISASDDRFDERLGRAP